MSEPFPVRPDANKVGDGATRRVGTPAAPRRLTCASAVVLSAALLFLAGCETTPERPAPPSTVEAAGSKEERPSPRLVPAVFIDESNPDSACSPKNQNLAGGPVAGHICLEILFATNRTLADPGMAAVRDERNYPENPDVFFADSRFGPSLAIPSDGYFRTVSRPAPTTLAYESYRAGRIVVTVPDDRESGDKIKPYDYKGSLLDQGAKLFGVTRTPTNQDRKTYFTTFGYKILSQHDFWERADFLLNLGDQLGNPDWTADSRSALVFVHGYNVSFSSAAYRTAQIVYDLRYAGAPFMFSWPANSDNDPLRYFNDVSEAAGAVGDLKLFLLDIKQKLNPSKFIIIAHSHGNQLLLRTLNEIAAERRDEEPLFDAIVFASPDVDAFEFRRLVERASNLARSKTLYTSSNDNANLGRQILNGLRLTWFKKIEVKPRAGFVPKGGAPVIASGVHSIDLTGAGMGKLGPEEKTARTANDKKRDLLLHDQYVSAADIVVDLRAIIAQPVDAAGAAVFPHCRTTSLQPRPTQDDPQYWRYDPASAQRTRPECASAP